MALLEVEGLNAGYGSVPVLHGVDLAVDQGEIVVLLGLNGAGKTTTLLAIIGLVRRTAGRVLYHGRSVDRNGPEGLARQGMVLIPEGRHVFPGLTVTDNLRLGAWSRRRDPGTVREDLQRAFEVFPALGERRAQRAGTLSSGEQQMLAIARGLMAGPRLLLIDEASLGLSPKLTDEVFGTVRRINEEGVTVLMVEQNAGALRIANRGYVMEKGRVVASGGGADLLGHRDLRAAYLGAPA
jgi:branched-chain amino acid transport system ATP-binding protein